MLDRPDPGAQGVHDPGRVLGVGHDAAQAGVRGLLDHDRHLGLGELDGIGRIHERIDAPGRHRLDPVRARPDLASGRLPDGVDPVRDPGRQLGRRHVAGQVDAGRRRAVAVPAGDRERHRRDLEPRPGEGPTREHPLDPGRRAAGVAGGRDAGLEEGPPAGQHPADVLAVRHSDDVLDGLVARADVDVAVDQARDDRRARHVDDGRCGVHDRTVTTDRPDAPVIADDEDVAIERRRTPPSSSRAPTIVRPGMVGSAGPREAEVDLATCRGRASAT